MMGLYEGILGVKRGYDGLEIAPVFPAEWDTAEMTRRFRGTDYHVVIRNPQHRESGNTAICVDGVPVSGQILPDFRDGKLHEVEVEIVDRV